MSELKYILYDTFKVNTRHGITYHDFILLIEEIIDLQGSFQLSLTYGHTSRDRKITGVPRQYVIDRNIGA